MFEIFVSYTQPQIDLASNLKRYLTAPGISVYVAETDLPPGTSLSDEISKAIQRADLFIVLWSKEARESQYVNKEVFAAHQARRPLIPVMLQPATPLPKELADIKYLDVAKDPAAQLGLLKTEVSRRARDKTISAFIGLGIAAFLAWAALSGRGK